MTRPNPINEDSSIEEIQYLLGSGWLNHDEYKRLIGIWNEKNTPAEALDPIKVPTPKKKKETAAEEVA